jgi:hypothetical protein
MPGTVWRSPRVCADAWVPGLPALEQARNGVSEVSLPVGVSLQCLVVVLHPLPERVGRLKPALLGSRVTSLSPIVFSSLATED